MHNIGVAPLPCIEEARGSTRILLQQILGPFRDSSAIISSAAGHGEGGGLAAGLEGVPRLKVDPSPGGCQGRALGSLGKAGLSFQPGHPPGHVASKSDELAAGVICLFVLFFSCCLVIVFV